MTRKLVRAKDLHKSWMSEPAYRNAYDNLGLEFSIARALVKARLSARMTQAEVAKQLKTTQTAISRMESGVVTVKSAAKYATAVGYTIDVVLKPGRLVKHKKPTGRIVRAGGTAESASPRFAERSSRSGRASAPRRKSR